MANLKSKALLLTAMVCICLTFNFALGQTSRFSVSISSVGTIGYALTPTPVPSATATPTPNPTITPTPIPTSKPLSNNLAPINDGQWHTDNTWSVAPANNVYLETNPANQHDGALTWRIEAYGSQPVEWAVDHAITLHGGDHVVLSGWIKTAGTYTGTPQHGAYIGLDYYDSAWHYIGGASNADAASTGDNWQTRDTTAETNANFVDWGVSTWQYRTWDFIVPTYAKGDGYGSYAVGALGLIANAQVWFMIWDGGNTNYQTAWISNFQFYINP